MQIKHNLPLLLVFVISLIFAIGSLSARSLYDSEGVISTPEKSLDDPFVTIRYHNLTNMGFSVTNQGQLGLWGENWMDPLNPSEPAKSLEYPLGSTETHLFGSALWVGAIVDGDTLVSVGADGWFQTQEMWPGDLFSGNMQYLSIDSGDAGAVSNQDFIAVFTDTLIDPDFVQSDPADGRPHIPLGIEITQKSHAWKFPYSEDFVIVEYDIKNIGSNYLEDVYLGILWDGDVYAGDEYPGFVDDIAGFKSTIGSNNPDCPFEYPINLAYIIDNNGRNYTDYDCPYSENSPVDAAGIVLLQGPVGSDNFNFNWWTSNTNTSLDFGPRMAGTAEDPFRDFGGHLGTPTGDRNKYYILSHPEFDYDQLYTAVDQTSSGWLPPPSQASWIASGKDVKFLLSTGGFDLAPGESVPLAIAVVTGENIHTDCDAYDMLFNPNFPDAYYNTLDFSDIGMNAVYASWVFDTPGFDTDGDGDSGKTYICCVDSEYVSGQWECTIAETTYYKGDGIPDLRGFFDTVYVEIDQEQLHWADGHLVDPEVLNITLTDLANDFIPPLVEESSVQVNGIDAENVSISSGSPVDKLFVQVDKAAFVSGYGIVWDNETHDFHVTGSQSDGFSFDYVGTVNIQGHISGDVNMDSKRNLLDILYLIDYKYKDGPPPRPIPEVGDVDGNGTIDLLDIMYYVNYKFRGGPPLKHP